MGAHFCACQQSLLVALLRGLADRHAWRAGWLELAGAVQLLLFLGVVHFGVEINLGNLQRLVPEPALYLHQVEARTQPIRRRRFAKSVKIMFLAHWLRFAVHLDCMTIVVSTHPNRRLALPAIQPSVLGNHFELAEEVTLGF